MGASASDALRRHLRVLDAAAIFVGIVLGSGIFIAPAAVAAAAPHPAAAAGLWLAGALVCACGAMTYAESAARLPRTGGFYVFYRAAFGEGAAFVGGWVAVAITYPASIAAIALILARYLGEIGRVPGGEPWTAAVAVVLAAALTIAGLRTGAVAQRALTGAKVGALALVCLAALVAGSGAPAGSLSGAGEGVAEGTLLGAVLVLLWTYEGWSDVTLVAGEVRDPGRGLLRAVLVGTGVLAALYALVQYAVTSLLGPFAADSTRPVADAVAAGLGPGSGRLVAALVVVCTFGSIQAVVLTTSRLAFAMARDRVFPPWFGSVHPALGTPARATLVVASASVVYVFVAGFRDLLAYFTFAVWIFYGVAATSLLVLRRRGIAADGPVRPPVWGAAPFVVLATGVFMTANLLVSDTKRSLTGLAILAAGFPIWAAWRAVRRGGGGSSATPR